MADHDPSTRYATQFRGDRGDYERYLRGMDASMQQKVALTAAYLLCRGRVADMGMGSGTGSLALAALYPALDVIGVDVSPEMVAMAREHHVRDNLSFVEGDIATPVFPEGSLDAIFDSSVLHHVTTFSGYDHDAAARALAVQAMELRAGGVLIVRDFLAVADAGEVLLEVRDDDGDDGDDPRTCSTAALLRRFAREFRSLHERPGFAFATEPDAPLGWARFRLPHRLAVEFVLRKDYRADWESEVKEEYTYFDQARFEAVFAVLGLRMLASTPIRNPWIVAHRFEGRIALRDVDGRALEVPATNYVIVGERVGPDRGVRFSREPAESTGFLAFEPHRERATGRIVDLVRRPHLTIDAVPWFRAAEDLFVLARMSYPRPIVGDTAGLDGSRAPSWSTEPLTVIQDDRPLAQTVEEALQARAGIGAEAIVGFGEGASYYPSPGGTQEEVRSVFVQVEPVWGDDELPATSGFSSSGRLGAIEARQLLRAAQVGGLPDARLELNVYALLRCQGVDPGPWIGAAITLEDRIDVPRPIPVQLGARTPRRAFVRTQERAGFLSLRAAAFVERDAAGRELARRVLEWVEPTTLSLRTIACAVLRRVAGTVYIGVAIEDRPAAQGIEGRSDLVVAPAWRLPREIETLTPARAFAAAQLQERHGVRARGFVELGGRYHPSPGVTPEVVHPFAVEAEGVDDGAAEPLCWVPLAELLEDTPSLRDGHLRIVAFRAAHALGVKAVNSAGTR